MTFLDYSKITISRDLLRRIFQNVVVQDCGYTSPCWIRKRNPTAYSAIRINGHNYVAHRVTYALFVEVPPVEQECDHLCRFPACCNPAHIEAVTPRENKLRGIGVSAVNARKTHCDKGHALTESNVWLVGKHKRFRVCKQCSTNHIRRYKEQKRGYPVRRYMTNECLRGHKRTPETTRIRSDGFQECKICQRMKRNEWRARRKAMGLPRD